jgi:hypothetical protein
MIVSTPAVTPVTIPVNEPTLAVALVLLHTPPEVLLESVIDALTHTLDGPLIAPTVGKRFTVITFVTAARPQAPLIV